MAVRQVYLSTTEGDKFVNVRSVEFIWYAGLSKVRKQLSIRSLHETLKNDLPNIKVLEVSSSSESELGVSLSAFNLTFPLKTSGKKVSVECAFQASKVFMNGGPYLDLMDVKPLEAKRDPRLQSSGRLINFNFFSQLWQLQPHTAFYDWLYINALHLQRELSELIMEYNGFTDIAFNPSKSVNCQAGAVALYVSLKRRNLLEKALESPESYLTLIGGSDGHGIRHAEGAQGSLF